MNPPKVPDLLDSIVYPDLRTARNRDAQPVVELPSNLKRVLCRPADDRHSVSLHSDTLGALPRALRRGDGTACAPVWGGSVDLLLCPRARRSPSGIRWQPRTEIAHLDKIEAKLAAAKDNYRAEQIRIPVSMERRAATTTGVAQQSRCRFLYERIHPHGLSRGPQLVLQYRPKLGIARVDGLLVSVPAPYISGDRDPVIEFPWTAHFADLAKFVPQLRCGHNTQEEQAAEVNATMMDFIRGLPRTGQFSGPHHALPPTCGRLFVMSAWGHGW